MNLLSSYVISNSIGKSFIRSSWSLFSEKKYPKAIYIVSLFGGRKLDAFRNHESFEIVHVINENSHTFLSIIFQNEYVWDYGPPPFSQLITCIYRKMVNFRK